MYNVGPAPEWRRSSFSNGQGGQCVEELQLIDVNRVAVRDSKNPDGGTLEFSGSAWSCFINHLK
jgi:hypothetical protein